MIAADSRFLDITSLLLPSRSVLSYTAEIEDEDAEPILRKTVKLTNINRTIQAPEASASPSSVDTSGYSPFYAVDSQPMPFTAIRPDYPPAAENAGIEGQVLLKVYIDEAGRVRKIEVLQSPDDSLTAAAVAAVEATRFRPAQVGGRPRAVAVHLPIRFTIR
jgi:protein TonB